MQKQLLTLLCMLLISVLLVASLGAYLKFETLAPLGLLEDKSVIELPFLVLKDPAVHYALRLQKQSNAAPAMEASTEAPTEIVTEAPTEEEPTETSMIPPTEMPTEAPTEPPYVPVTEQWFDDVLFIGDSRTVGLREYARLGDADYFCSVGMTVFDAMDTRESDVGFSQMHLEQLLKERRYSKIYISLGLNECGYPYDLLMDGYGTLLNTVRRLQPHAVVILQSMITVSRRKAASQWYFSLENLNRVNEGIQEFADGTTVRFIDANTYFADEEGYLPSEKTADGCHFYPSGYQEWAQWIYDNAKTLNISFG